MSRANYDCIVIGHNEPPFEDYERLVRAYGSRSTTYRDLRMSAVRIDGRHFTYTDLLNDTYERAGIPIERPFQSGDIPHLACAYLTNFLHRRGFSATYVSLFQRDKERLAALLSGNPRCVAITTTLYVLNFPANEVVEFIRSCNPAVPIVIGGPLIANCARIHRETMGAGAPLVGNAQETEDIPFQTVIEDIGADIYVIEGQGELTLSRIVDCLRAGRDLGEVPNIVFREGKRYRETAAVPEQNDMNAVDIDWRQAYGEPVGITLQTRTARSCAFKCSFCNYPTRAGKLSLASIDTVIRELDSMRDLGGVRNVVFIDDTFNVPLDRFKDLCRAMIARNYQFNWFSYFRCSNSDEEAIELMKRSGCKGVFLGIESGSPVILKNMNKAATVDKYEIGIRLLREHGITTFASFIMGFPGETAVTVQETVEFIRANRPDFYRAQIWYCEPGTPIQLERQAFNIAGEGFNWSHSTMTSQEAMAHVEKTLQSVQESEWLPLWSFDFWILPYLLGRGLTIEQVRQFTASANRLLKLQLSTAADEEKAPRERRFIEETIQCVRSWSKEADAMTIEGNGR